MPIFGEQTRKVAGRAGLILPSVALALALAGNLWSQGQALRSYLITLTKYGFEPKTITIRPGPLYLVFRSRLPGRPELQFTEVGRSGPTKALRDRGKGHGKEQLELSPGTFELRDSRFPQWKCTLQVTP